jgi:hypothetical protein
MLIVSGSMNVLYNGYYNWTNNKNTLIIYTDTIASLMHDTAMCECICWSAVICAGYRKAPAGVPGGIVGNESV